MGPARCIFRSPGVSCNIEGSIDKLVHRQRRRGMPRHIARELSEPARG